MGKLLNAAALAIKPRERLTVSEWADQNRFLSPEASAEYGRWRTDRAPYQREIMDVTADRSIKQVVVMTSAQVGKSECLLNIMGYFLDYEPSPILMVQPTLEMSQAFSKDRIAPMLRDSPVFHGKLRASRSEGSGNTLLHKQLRTGGQITLVGANSPAGLASRPIRVVLADEIDRWPESAGLEADPLSLAAKRTATFWNSLIFLVSTPTIKDSSRIEKAWAISDQRLFHVACVHCGHEQPLKWEGLTYKNKGNLDLSRDGAQIEDIGYRCESCGGLIPEHHKSDLLRRGRWIPSRQSAGIAGFHLCELSSPWRKWADIALDYEAARQDPLLYQVWWNTSLGLPFEPDTRTRYDWENLLFRSEDSDYSMGQLPPGALYLTAGVDVQGDRLEAVICGWGEGEECWVLDYQKFYGDPLAPTIWDELEGYLARRYQHPMGGEISVSKVAVDTSNWTHDCYMEVRKRRNWLAIKGDGGNRPLVAPPKLMDVNWRGQKIKRGIKLHILGVDLAKQTLLSRCRIDTPGPKYLNLPVNIGQEFCRGFAGSEIQIKKHRAGQPYFAWEPLPGVRNEPLDCMVYAYCAAIQSGVARFNWERIRKRLTVIPSDSEPAPEVPEPEAAPERVKSQIPQPARRRPKGDSNWATQAGDFSRRRW